MKINNMNHLFLFVDCRLWFLSLDPILSIIMCCF